jgi:hypothetical protein
VSIWTFHIHIGLTSAGGIHTTCRIFRDDFYGHRENKITNEYPDHEKLAWDWATHAVDAAQNAGLYEEHANATPAQAMSVQAIAMVVILFALQALHTQLRINSPQY